MIKHLLFFLTLVAIIIALGSRVMDGATGAILFFLLLTIWMGPFRMIRMVLRLIMLISLLG